MDNKQRIYEYSEGLSNFWLVVLRPGGSNFGYIVFEVPQDSEPAKLILSKFLKRNKNEEIKETV